MSAPIVQFTYTFPGPSLTYAVSPKSGRVFKEVIYIQLDGTQVLPNIEFWKSILFDP